MNRPTLACAHRGLSAEEPENTLAAFRAAAKAGAHVMELDVRLSHDGHVVVMHDENIARSTDGVGRVGDLDLAEIQSHHTADGPVPSLTDVFDALGDWDGVWNIEIKAKKATRVVMDLIQERGMGDRTIITSMDPAALLIAHEHGADVDRGLIVLGPPDDDDMDVAKETQCAWFMVHEDFIDANLVQTCLQAGHQVGAWTVNDVGRAKELVGLGVHMVMTDRRDVLEALL